MFIKQSSASNASRFFFRMPRSRVAASITLGNNDPLLSTSSGMYRWERIIICLLCISFGAACQGDIEQPSDDSKTSAMDFSSIEGDASPSGDSISPSGDTGESLCTEGDKMCGTLHEVHICKNGKWEMLVDCNTKKWETHTCTCSMTLMFICAYGTNECQ